MKHYIDKSALVAEIKRLKSIKLSIFSRGETEEDCYNALSCISVYNEILSLIESLEVKEVDLEKELETLIEKEKAFVADNREVKYYNGDSFNHIYELEFIAKHFFELGLKVKKGE